MNRLAYLIAFCTAILPGIDAAAVPIRTVPNLFQVRIYEATLTTTMLTYFPTASALTTRRSDPLSASNRDFGFVDDESYDVFYSNADGTLNALGDYLSIEGVWRRPELRPDGGMNINEVELVFSGQNSHTQFGDFVSSFVVGSIRDPNFGANFIPGSEALAVDHDLTTFPRFGQTSTTDLNERFRLTIGFNGISNVPEPSSLVLAALGTVALIVLRRRPWRAQGARHADSPRSPLAHKPGDAATAGAL